MAAQPLVVRISDACTALSIGRTKLYELVNAGHLKSVKVMGAPRITMESVRAVAAGQAAND